jgi:hypothetical protein
MEQKEALWQARDGFTLGERPFGSIWGLGSGESRQCEVAIHGVREWRCVCGFVIEKRGAFPGIGESVDPGFGGEFC